MAFKPCVNRMACTEDGTHCRGCGRPHEEINQVRKLVNDTHALITRWEYENIDDLFDYLQKKLIKKLKR